jgi:hypothetical protein
MRSPLGGKITGLVGVTIRDEYAPSLHVTQDGGLIARTQRAAAQVQI